MRVGDDSAGDPSRDLASDVLWLSFAIEAGRLLTRSGDSGCSGDGRLAGKSKGLGGSMASMVQYVRLSWVMLLSGQLHVVCVTFGVDSI